MKKNDVIIALQTLFADCPGNILTEETAMTPELIGMPIFDMPLIGFGAADDPLFSTYQETGVIGPWHKKPIDWLPDANTVISLFFPFSEPVRVSNRGTQVSRQWLQGRVEGQAFINACMAKIRDWLVDQGVAACIPAMDPRFFASEGSRMVQDPAFPAGGIGSNWSERHAAYVCGLGTFGLSKGLITKKGMAGRFGSILTSMNIEADHRPYHGTYDYCIMCGACIQRCPRQAISLKTGKDHPTCKQQLDQSRVLYAPRYGCGLCQTGVPCESKIPSRKTNDN